MSMDCKRPEKAWSILYRVTGKIVLVERTVNSVLTRSEITPKYSPSQSALAHKPVERLWVV